MLSRNLKRVLLDSRWPLPPTFLLPWASGLSTVSHTIDTSNIPPPPLPRREKLDRQPRVGATRPESTIQPAASSLDALPPPNDLSSPPAISSSVRDLLPLLKAQSPQYITLHIHGKPYLLTQGDTLRLPFFAHGLEPGDVLRLNRAINIGSRDYTLKAAAPAPKLKSPTTATQAVIDPTSGTAKSESRVMPSASSGEGYAPHFIPHIEKGKHSYLDERLFVCRAVVMGVESEPLRIKEKTKRRQRKVKTVKSKHRFTVLKIKELRVKDVDEIEESREAN